MAENPYAPPKADVDAVVPSLAVEPDIKMPAPVLATVIIFAVLILLQLIGTIAGPGRGGTLSIGVSILILIGLIRGHALAWQWGRVIPVLILVGFGSITAFAIGSGSMSGFELALLVIPFALFVPLPILLSFQSSRVFFGLKCPKCGAVKGRAASFLFAKRRCGACRHEWFRQRKH